MPQPILIPFCDVESREKTGLSAFSTSLAKKHGKEEFYQAISLFPACVFALIMKRKGKYT